MITVVAWHYLHQTHSMSMPLRKSSEQHRSNEDVIVDLKEAMPRFSHAAWVALRSGHLARPQSIESHSSYGLPLYWSALSLRNVPICTFAAIWCHTLKCQEQKNYWFRSSYEGSLVGKACALNNKQLFLHWCYNWASPQTRLFLFVGPWCSRGSVHSSNC